MFRLQASHCEGTREEHRANALSPIQSVTDVAANAFLVDPVRTRRGGPFEVPTDSVVVQVHEIPRNEHARISSKLATQSKQSTRACVRPPFSPPSVPVGGKGLRQRGFHASRVSRSVRLGVTSTQARALPCW